MLGATGRQVVEVSTSCGLMLLASNLGRFNWLDKQGAECPRCYRSVSGFTLWGRMSRGAESISESCFGWVIVGEETTGLEVCSFI